MGEQRVSDEVAQLGGLVPLLGQVRADPEELARQVRKGFQHPLEFPGIGEFLFSGDRIVIAVHSGLPQAELLLDPLLAEFAANGRVEQVTWLFADRETAH